MNRLLCYHLGGAEVHPPVRSLWQRGTSGTPDTYCIGSVALQYSQVGRNGQYSLTGSNACATRPSESQAMLAHTLHPMLRAGGTDSGRLHWQDSEGPCPRGEPATAVCQAA